MSFIKCIPPVIKAVKGAKGAAKGAGKGKPPSVSPKPPEPTPPKPPSPSKKPDPRHEHTTPEQRAEMNKAQPNVNNPSGSKPPDWVTKKQAEAYRDKAAEAAKNAKNDAARKTQEAREKYWEKVIKDKS
jgi:hypothetical protein